MISKLISFLIIFIVISGPLQAFSRDSDFEIEVFKLIKDYWQLKNSYYKISDDSNSDKVNNYLDEMDKFREKSEILATEIIKYQLVDEFIDMYFKLDDYNKEALNGTLSTLRDQTPDLNFPGYGYPEPGYQYRKGLEISREKLNSFWRNEERFLEINQENELTMEAKFLSDFTSSLQSGESARVVDRFNVDINGEIKSVVKIKYTIHRTLKVNCTVKYQKTKVWYELHRRKINWLSYGSWNLCGKTYVIDEEPTEDVVVGRIM